MSFVLIKNGRKNSPNENGETFYYDKKGIKKEDGFVYVWTLGENKFGDLSASIDYTK